MLFLKSIVRWTPLVILGFLVSACGAITGTSEVSDLETQKAQLQGTIEAMGTPAATIASLQLTAEQSISIQANLTVAQATIIAMQSGVQPVQQAQYTPAPVGGNGTQPGGQATPDPAMMGGSQATTPSNSITGSTTLPVTMATTIDSSNDCALDSTSTFEIYEDTIYADITFPELHAGSVVNGRWTANGVVYEESLCWNVSSEWTNVCSNCYITPKAGTFEPGVWSVDIILDGQVVGSAEFQVIDSSAGQTTE
jgi:hypothetical protein